MKSRMRGIATVEFAIVGALFFIILFGVIEIARGLFVWNTLTEATRRGARIAAVCPVDHSAIANITVFNDATNSGASSVLPTLSPANVEINYLDAVGDAVTDTVTNYLDIRHVRVRIINYQHDLMIPFFYRLLDAPPFATTLPRESLGVPRVGVAASCFGTAA